ncbi:MAG: hypothetical protein HYY17_09540 [Planctomycetes bacterium]|nr:hypothetical protein [Planctomycetota bacterium]
MTIKPLDEIPVTYVVADGGVGGSRAAFDRLEAKVGSLKGRRFFGALRQGEYRACVAIEPGDEPAALTAPRRPPT